MAQQRQLKALRDIVERQNRVIRRLCQRDVTLGLELRQTNAHSKDARSDASRVTSAQAADHGRTLFFIIYDDVYHFYV